MHVTQYGHTFTLLHCYYVKLALPRVPAPLCPFNLIEQFMFV